MASATKLAFALFIAASLFINSALAEIVCETLPRDICAYAVASTGERCILETFITKGRLTEYQCKASQVMAASQLAGFIESDACVKACGVERKTVGISSDSLLDSAFTAKLCSPECFQKCANIVDLFFNLAAGEGAYLIDLCKAQGGHHRSMIELSSSGQGEKYVEEHAYAPVPAPSQWI